MPHADARPLTVLSVAYPFAPVTADPAGGAEQVLAQIDRALVSAGHRSVVVAAEGSLTAGELSSVTQPSGTLDDGACADVRSLVRDRVSGALAAGDVDVVHLHGVDFADYLPAPSRTPKVVSLHLPLDWYPEGALAPGRDDVWLQPVSEDQARRAPPSAAALAPPIANGVDVEAYAPAPSHGDYALVIARVAEEKGFHLALDAARLADAPLLACGKLYPYAAHQQYFEAQVRPRLDDRRRFLGPVEGARKRELLAGARCLLAPFTAPETSSLVSMEALASGVPVIAFRSGALAEIVEDGVTGFLVDGVEEMADAIRRVDRIDRARCREAACRRFPVQRATDAYLDLYRRLAA